MLALPLLLLLCALAAVWNFYWKRRGLPPGPTPLPIFGNTLALKRCLYEPFRRWTREFGPVFTVWMGEHPVVVVTELGSMRDMFVKDGNTFAGRHFMAQLTSHYTALKDKTTYGVIKSEGELWKVTRRFGLQAMRNLGVGKANLERQYLADIGTLVAEVRAEVDVNCNGKSGKDKGKYGGATGSEGVDLQPRIERLIGSTINRLLFGYAFNNDQLDEFYTIKQSLDRQMRLMQTVTGQMLMTTPWLRHLPVFSATFAGLDQNAAGVFAFHGRIIRARMAEREETKKKLALAKELNGNEEEAELVEKEEPRDLTDHFLDQMELAERDPEAGKHFVLSNLLQLCFDLFLAGQETTSSTLNWLVLYLLLDQRAQAKLHEELDRLEAETERSNGSEHDPGISLADRPKLPFLSAVINETQRLCNLFPMNLTHRTAADVEIMGGKFLLRKGTTIVPQISCLLYDEKIFPNPLRFEPERFLDEHGQLKRCEQLIPFGLGKRICMGESLARMEMFLFTANFFRNFQVLPVDPLNPPTSRQIRGFTMSTHPYKCRLRVRGKKGGGGNINNTEML